MGTISLWPSSQQEVGLSGKKGNWYSSKVLPLQSAKLEIYRKPWCTVTSHSSRDKPWSELCGSYCVPYSPCAAAVALFRLYAYLDLATKPNCVLCASGQPMTSAHVFYSK